MKAQEFYYEENITHNNLDLFQTEFTYNSLYPLRLTKKEIFSHIEDTFYKNFRDKVEPNTYYVFKIISEKPITDKNSAITKIVYRIEVKKADTANIVCYTYDEYASNVFKKKNNFWQRLKLSFKYLFRRPL